MAFEGDLNLKATELRLGLPGSDEPQQKQSTSSVTRGTKRASPEISEESRTRSNITSASSINVEKDCAPPAK